jgi:methylmalonyl-CoA/ethylmalonyl-CoA epimerase
MPKREGSINMTSSSNLIQKLDLPDLSQIGMVVKDMNRAIEYYEKTIGLKPFIRSDRDIQIDFQFIEYRGKKVDSKWTMAFTSLAPVELELIQPLSGPTIYNEFLQNGCEGLHHLGFDVKDIEARIERYRNMGIEVIQQGQTRTARFAYLDTGKIGGTVFELIQRSARRA